jgi:hypothetical protein
MRLLSIGWVEDKVWVCMLAGIWDRSERQRKASASEGIGDRRQG